MTDDRDARRLRTLSARPTSDKVGYGNPPSATRFQPGRSGNPRGRPPGSKNKQPTAMNVERLKEVILEEAYRPVQVNDPSGPLTIPMAQAVFRSIAVNAAKGQQRSQRLFTELVGDTERYRKAFYDRWFRTAVNYKAEWDHELERRQKLGIPGPEPLPHPDDLVINTATATVDIRGPLTREEKGQWESAAQFRERGRAEIARWERKLKRTRDVDERANIEEAIEIYQGTLAQIVEVIGEWPNRPGPG